jgi:hypothetical protein
MKTVELSGSDSVAGESAGQIGEFRELAAVSPAFRTVEHASRILRTGAFYKLGSNLSAGNHPMAPGIGSRTSFLSLEHIQQTDK